MKIWLVSRKLTIQGEETIRGNTVCDLQFIFMVSIEPFSIPKKIEWVRSQTLSDPLYESHFLSPAAEFSLIELKVG